MNKVKEYFINLGFEEKYYELNESSATVELAALALGCTEGEIAKTLSFDCLGKTIVIVMAGDKKIDNQKFKTYFHTKATMIKYEEVEQRIGHKVGGVCPFCLNENVEVYLDESLKEYEYVYPAGGTSNTAVKLTIEEMEKYTNFKEWIDVTK